MKVKDLGQAAKKFSTNAQAGSANYASGVQNNQSWAANTQAAAPTWAQGVSSAASNGRFAKGVAKAGQAKWQGNSVSKGQSRFQQAVSRPQAQQNWQAGFSLYAAVIAGITKPPKGVRGSPGNYAVVQAIGDALHKAKAGSYDQERTTCIECKQPIPPRRMVHGAFGREVLTCSPKCVRARKTRLQRFRKLFERSEAPST